METKYKKAYKDIKNQYIGLKTGSSVTNVLIINTDVSRAKEAKDLFGKSFICTVTTSIKDINFNNYHLVLIMDYERDDDLANKLRTHRSVDNDNLIIGCIGSGIKSLLSSSLLDNAPVSEYVLTTLTTDDLSKIRRINYPVVRYRNIITGTISRCIELMINLHMEKNNNYQHDDMIIDDLVFFGTKQLMKKQELNFEEDSLYVVVLGSGCPLPDKKRMGPSLAVLTKSSFFIVDAGDGAARNIRLCGLDPGKLNGLLLTHFHSDHITGVGEIMLQRWMGLPADTADTGPLPIYGPQGIEQLVEGFNLAYSMDNGYRNQHHHDENANLFDAGGIANVFNGFESTVVLEHIGLKITAFPVNHSPVDPAVGYVFEYKGKKIVISGDTSYSTSIYEHSIDADVLFHEAMNKKLVHHIHKLNETNKKGQIMHDILSYHSSPSDVAQIATAANVKMIIYYHIIPPIPSILNSYFIGKAKEYYNDTIHVSQDGMLVKIDKKKKISVSYLL